MPGGSFCFPSLSLYVVCCPNQEVTTPQLAGCPVEFQTLQDQCCTEDVRSHFLSLADVPPEHQDHDEAMRLLWYFLRDIDLSSLEAWRILVKRTSQAANLKMFEFKSGLKNWDSEELRSTAMKLSRLMGKTMHRIEGLQQFCLWHLATATGRMVTEVSPESCDMELLQYKTAAANHNYLAYSLLPHLETELSSQLKGLSPSQWPSITLQVVCIGKWAQQGFVTLRSLLQHRSSALRIFVLSDSEGWSDWLKAWAELPEKSPGVSFERIDFARFETFHRYMTKRYPSNCRFHHEIERAMLARVVCHELLPEDVHWVISMDLGDLLVLDDISELWQFRPLVENHFLAISYAPSLGQHLNAGLVLYNLQQMRQKNFTELTLQAAWEITDETCPRDQQILNRLNDEDFLLPSSLKLEKAKLLRVLPCRWSFFPAVDWHPAWSRAALWHPQVAQRLRYPGLVSSTKVELYCPDSMDLLMAFAFLPISSQQSRIRIYAEQEGGQQLRHCHPLRLEQSCCTCGEEAAVVHVAGDLKQWPAMRNFLGHSEAASVSSERWWGGTVRQQKLKEQSEEQMFLMAKEQGLELLLSLGSSWCRTLRTNGGAYRASGLGQLQGERLDVQTTADEFRLFLSSSNRSLEIVMHSQQVVEVLNQHGHQLLVQAVCPARDRWIPVSLGFGNYLQLDLCDDQLVLPFTMPGGISLEIASQQAATWAVCVT